MGADDPKQDVDWSRVRKQGRAKIVYISYDELMDYFAVRNGELAMVHMVDTYDLPVQWAFFGSAHMSFERRAVSFIILSPEFDKVLAGCELPRLPETRQQVKITREIISRK